MEYKKGKAAELSEEPLLEENEEYVPFIVPHSNFLVKYWPG